MADSNYSTPLLTPLDPNPTVQFGQSGATNDAKVGNDLVDCPKQGTQLSFPREQEYSCVSEFGQITNPRQLSPPRHSTWPPKDATAPNDAKASEKPTVSLIIKKDSEKNGNDKAAGLTESASKSELLGTYFRKKKEGAFGSGGMPPLPRFSSTDVKKASPESAISTNEPGEEASFQMSEGPSSRDVYDELPTRIDIRTPPKTLPDLHLTTPASSPILAPLPPLLKEDMGPLNDFSITNASSKNTTRGTASTRLVIARPSVDILDPRSSISQYITSHQRLISSLGTQQAPTSHSPLESINSSRLESIVNAGRFRQHSRNHSILSQGSVDLSLNTPYNTKVNTPIGTGVLNSPNKAVVVEEMEEYVKGNNSLLSARNRSGVIIPSSSTGSVLDQSLYFTPSNSNNERPPTNLSLSLEMADAVITSSSGEVGAAQKEKSFSTIPRDVKTAAPPFYLIPEAIQGGNPSTPGNHEAEYGDLAKPLGMQEWSEEDMATITPRSRIKTSPVKTGGVNNATSTPTRHLSNGRTGDPSEDLSVDGLETVPELEGPSESVSGNSSVLKQSDEGEIEMGRVDYEKREFGEDGWKMLRTKSQSSNEVKTTNIVPLSSPRSPTSPPKSILKNPLPTPSLRTPPATAPAAVTSFTLPNLVDHTDGRDGYRVDGYRDNVTNDANGEHQAFMQAIGNSFSFDSPRLDLSKTTPKLMRSHSSVSFQDLDVGVREELKRRASGKNKGAVVKDASSTSFGASRDHGVAITNGHTVNGEATRSGNEKEGISRGKYVGGVIRKSPSTRSPPPSPKMGQKVKGVLKSFSKIFGTGGKKRRLSLGTIEWKDKDKPKRAGLGIFARGNDEEPGKKDLNEESYVQVESVHSGVSGDVSIQQDDPILPDALTGKSQSYPLQAIDFAYHTITPTPQVHSINDSVPHLHSGVTPHVEHENDGNWILGGAGTFGGGYEKDLHGGFGSGVQPLGSLWSLIGASGPTVSPLVMPSTQVSPMIPVATTGDSLKENDKVKEHDAKKFIQDNSTFSNDSPTHATSPLVRSSSKRTSIDKRMSDEKRRSKGSFSLGKFSSGFGSSRNLDSTIKPQKASNEGIMSKPSITSIFSRASVGREYEKKSVEEVVNIGRMKEEGDGLPLALGGVEGDGSFLSQATLTLGTR